MGKKFASFISPILVIGFLLLLANPAYSHHQKRVLGESTTVLPSASVPPTVEGPGLVLPDSPLFFLDEIKQNIRLLFAFTPEAKAKVRASVAGERLAEVRIMLVKKNKKEAEKGLKAVANNLAEAASNISNAGLTGRDISRLARDINNNIKIKQKFLDELEINIEEELKPTVKAVNKILLEAKVKVEDALPEDELENEIRDDLERKIEKRVREASESAEGLKEDLEELHNQATDAAKKSLKRREEAIAKAIEKRNEVLRKVEEKLLEIERKKQEKLLNVEKKASEQARKTIEKAQEAAVGFQRAREVIKEIRTRTSDTDTSGSSSGPNSSGDSKSGDSGSSGSGSSQGSDRSGSGGKD